ncbi:18S rRNA maturation protein [Steccherinum ochraceum]|uniref:rRNA-processing protein EFG1 n=1 Tax=Steccherinum ochraceum TaxID=92696 RepID=A0A4R0S0W7_9APHY|nr:18S rRNA maturation protein [Steccherinum ochraceum]
MAPTRTSRVSNSSYSQGSSSTKKHGSKPKHIAKGLKPGHDSDSQAGVPGVQKIKSLLRQSRRLLAKDKLAADVRQATERKIRALEKDLAEAERVRKERAMATRYHKVKFFERQKVTRKLNQAKKQLEACSDKAEKKALKKTLLELRIDLNYIQASLLMHVLLLISHRRS